MYTMATKEEMFVILRRHVKLAREANHQHVKTLKLGYATCEFTFVESRNLHMNVARAIAAYWR